MNYSNMIEEKHLKKGFIIATLISTIVGTFTASMTLHDKVQEKRNRKAQNEKDLTQDGEIQQLKDKLDAIEDHAKDIKNQSGQSRSSRSRHSRSPSRSRSRSRSRVGQRRRSRNQRRREEYSDGEDPYLAYHRPRWRSRAGLSHTYVEELPQLTPGYVRGDLVSADALQLQLMQLQHTLQDVLHSNRTLSKQDVDHIVAAQRAADRMLAERQAPSSRKPASEPIPDKQDRDMRLRAATGKSASDVDARTAKGEPRNQAKQQSASLEAGRPGKFLDSKRPTGKHRSCRESGPPLKDKELQPTKTVVSGKTVRRDRQQGQNEPETNVAATKTHVSPKATREERQDQQHDPQGDQTLSTKAMLSGKPTQPKREPATRLQDGDKAPHGQNREATVRASQKNMEMPLNEEIPKKKVRGTKNPMSVPREERTKEPAKVPSVTPIRDASAPPGTAASAANPSAAAIAGGTKQHGQRERSNRPMEARAASPRPVRRGEVAERIEVQYLSRRRSAPGCKLPPRDNAIKDYVPPAVVPPANSQLPEPKKANSSPAKPNGQIPGVGKKPKALPEPPSRSVYCRYSQDLQANSILPLHNSFRTSGNHRCPKCDILVPVDTRDVWVLSTYDPASRETRDYRMDARYIVKCHTPEGDFACLLCARSRKAERILGDWQTLIEHLGTEHGPAEFESEVDFVRMQEGSRGGGVKVKAGGKEMLLTR